MPLPMVHLGVANEILKAGFKSTDLPQFFLGVISPDAIHMHQNTDRSAKDKTHLMQPDSKWADVDEKEYGTFMLDFINLHKSKVRPAFLWGYGIANIERPRNKSSGNHL